MRLKYEPTSEPLTPKPWMQGATEEEIEALRQKAEDATAALERGVKKKRVCLWGIWFRVWGTGCGVGGSGLRV